MARIAAAHNGTNDAIRRALLLQLGGAVSRLSATAVASISMWPISSVAVCISMSRYFGVGPRPPQDWNMYWMQTRISSSTPPIACCSIRANSGSGFPTRTGYSRCLS
jgi:hypothetical protein